MSDKNTIARLYTNNAALKAWLNQSRCENKSKQAEINKQAAVIELLREALELFRPEIYYNQDGEEVDVGGNFTIYSDGDADNEAMQKVHEALSAAEHSGVLND